ncbi:MAG TPA: SDR family oxidoreductase [Marinilabiliaceae bacterium]|nr:SDR family oxidoreductase [Marinilabiliaceae bacterium]
MRRILITGGTGNIGSRLVHDMLNDGHFVYFTTRSIESGKKLIKAKGLDIERCVPIEVDFFEEFAITQIINRLFDLPDCIIHNARSLDTLKINERNKIAGKQFQDEFFLGITFPYLLTNAIIDQGNALKDVLFIGSMYGNVAPSPSLYTEFEKQSPINYGVVKAAQIHLVKELAVRLAPKRIRVNTISYGGVEGRVNDDFKNRYSKLVPTGRMLTHNDLYPPVKYFLSNPELNVTGENLKVDGGWTIW